MDNLPEWGVCPVPETTACRGGPRFRAREANIPRLQPGVDGAEWCADRRLSQRGVLGDGWGSPAGLERHCAAYPVELPSWAIQVHSLEPGEVVLDPFAGSMTSLVAAHRIGRRGWGIELGAGYLADGVKRLEAELAQLTLLDAGAA